MLGSSPVGYISLTCFLEAARNATATEGEDADGEMPLMDGAKAVAEAIARVMKATKEVAANPNDQQARENLRSAQELLSGTHST